jgi:hypothetical protein
MRTLIQSIIYSASGGAFYMVEIFFWTSQTLAYSRRAGTQRAQKTHSDRLDTALRVSCLILNILATSTVRCQSHDFVCHHFLLYLGKRP